MAGKGKTEKRNGKENLNALAALYTAALIVAALAIFVLPSFLVPMPSAMSPDFGAEQHITPSSPPPEPSGQSVSFLGMSIDMQDYFLMRLLLSVLNVALVVYLVFVYVKDYLKLRTAFTLGIVAFLFSFLLYALSTIPLHNLLGHYSIANIFSFVPMLFSALGLLIFAKISNE